MNQIAFLRHGITYWNIEKRLQGQTDTSLTDTARSQLRDLQLPLQFRESKIYVSPLQRARETAVLISKRDALIPVEALMEMNWGEWEGQILPLLRSKLGETMSANEARGLDFQPPGGESPRLVQQRLRAWLRTLDRQPHPVLAVTHKGIIRAAYCDASGWDMLGKPSHRLDWRCVQLFEFNADGALKIKQLNIPLLGVCRT